MAYAIQVLFSLCILPLWAPILASEHETRLMYDLFVKRDYRNDLRPVFNLEKPTKITVSLDVKQILEVNTKQQYLRLWNEFREQWTDDFLTWNPDDYGGLQSVTIDQSKVWQPDTYLYNSMVMDAEDTENVQPIRLEAFYDNTTGQYLTRVTKRLVAIYTAACKVKVKHFPWDVQYCNLTVASWAQSNDKLQYSFGKRLKRVQQNLEWLTLNINFHPTDPCYSFTPPIGEPFQECYSQLDFEIVYARRPTFYTVAIVLPTVIVIQVSYFGIFSMSDSTGERAEKFSLGVSSILALSVLLLVVGDLMPRASDPVPDINTFFLSQIIMMSAALMISAVLIQIQTYGNGGPPMPRWLRCCLFKCGKKKGKKEERIENATMELRSKLQSHTQRINQDMPKLWHYRRQLQRAVHTIKQLVIQALDMSQEDDTTDSTVRDWVNLVSRIEKVLLLLFTLGSIVGTLFYISRSLGPYVEALDQFCSRTKRGSKARQLLGNFCDGGDLNSQLIHLMAKAFE